MTKGVVFLVILFFNLLFASSSNAQEPFYSFMNTVVPNLKMISQREEIRRSFVDGENPLDTLTFAYRLATYKLSIIEGRQIPVGAWNDAVKKEMNVFLSILCNIGDVLSIRKNKIYRMEMSRVRPILTRGSYAQTIRELLIRPKAYQMSIGQLRQRTLNESDFSLFFNKEVFLRYREILERH